MIIDAHAHLGRNEWGNVDYYLQLMATHNIDKMIVVPGDNIPPHKLADFMRGNEQIISMTPANDCVIDATTSYPDKFLGFYMFDPDQDEVDNMQSVISKNKNIVGIKLNPIISRLSFRDPKIVHAFEWAAEANLPIYTHIMLSGGASLEALRPLAYDVAATVIVGHMGFASSDHEAILLAAELENVFLETSTGSYAAICSALEMIGPSKLIFGSEGPSHHPRVELEKIHQLPITDDEKDLILGQNILNILGA